MRCFYTRHKQRAAKANLQLLKFLRSLCSGLAEQGVKSVSLKMCKEQVWLQSKVLQEFLEGLKGLKVVSGGDKKVRE